MASLSRPGRRPRLVPLSITLVLAATMLRPDARAASNLGGTPPTATTPGPSSDADLTWGTGLTTDNRAERVNAISAVGSRVYLAGDFTMMTPPGAKAIPPPTTTTTAPPTTTTTEAPSTSTTEPPTSTTQTSTPTTKPASTTTQPASVSPKAQTSSSSPPAGLLRTEPPGVVRHHLAALDVDKHTLLPWDPDADGTVQALTLSADRTQIYVGGDFDHIGGTPAAKLARLDLLTGAVDPTFHPGVRGSVRALALAGDRLYVGGTFNTVAGPNGPESRPKLAALDAATGELLPWMPPALGPGRYVSHSGSPMPNDSPGDVLALAVPPVDGLVYVAGNFLDFGGARALVVLDPVTGGLAPSQWDIRRPIFDLAVSPADGQTVFASGGGSGGQAYAFRSTQPKRPVWATWVDGDAPGVAASRTTVYLMGHYDYVGADNDLRHHLAAFDAKNGAVDGWNPTANTPYGAFAAAVGADHVFVGGEFTRINGHPQPGFAQFAIPPPPPPPPPPTTTSTSSTTSTTSTTTTSTTTTSTTTTSTTGAPVPRSAAPR
jgi:hypothetical protein